MAALQPRAMRVFDLLQLDAHIPVAEALTAMLTEPRTTSPQQQDTDPPRSAPT
ncbi:hypothetical protein [Actinomadura sp. 21ATH]|uniref:hypothetical protein n=1 Tax=Actinomadura sp. 21ATH TaxID=1735444 RepID=UPI0035C0E583